MQATKHASEGSISALKPRADVISQKSKTGVPMAPQIGLMPSKFFKKILEDVVKSSQYGI